MIWGIISAMLRALFRVILVAETQKAREAVQTEERVHEAADGITDRNSALDSLRHRKP